MPIVIRAKDRVCLFGRTGSGKSTAAKAFLAGVPEFDVLDPKHTFRMAQVPVVKQYSTRKRRQILRPPYSNEDWETAIYRAWRRKRRILYIDELLLVNEGHGARLSPQLGRAIRTGRELELGVWMGSQRPKDIPSAVFTETDHFFIFQLTWEEDRKKVVSFTNSRIRRDLDALTGHEFVYYNANDNSWFKGLLSSEHAKRLERVA